MHAHAHPEDQARLEIAWPIDPIPVQQNIGCHNVLQQTQWCSEDASVATTATTTPDDRLRARIHHKGERAQGNKEAHGAGGLEDRATIGLHCSSIALELSRQINWFPDVVHGNDWHTALSLYYSLTKRWEEGARHVASVLTLHNLPFMGPDVSGILDSYGLKLAQTDLPDWARVMPLPLGLWSSDAILGVSPTYVKEILTEEYGCGLNEFLQLRHETLSGILNGLDTDSFNPETDTAIGVNFALETLEKRAANKKLLQARLGLPQESEIPLFAIISHMDVQKGVDLAFSALNTMKRLNWQAVILGTGDPKLEEAAMKLQELFPERIKVETRYDAGLARQIYAGSDMFLMPSRYEPCGLSQMIAMRYGCVPIVRAAGGLNDTVRHGVTGFVFEKAHHLSLVAAVKSLDSFCKPRTITNKHSLWFFFLRLYS